MKKLLKDFKGDTEILCSFHDHGTKAKTCQEPPHATVIHPGTSHNGFNVYVVPQQTASLTLLRQDHPLRDRTGHDYLCTLKPKCVSVIHCKRASLELQIDALARLTSTPLGTIPPSLKLTLSPLILTPIHTSPSVSLSSPSLYWVVCLSIPVWSAKSASACSWAWGQGHSGQEDEERWRKRVKRVLNSTTPEHEVGLCVLFLQQVSHS